MNETFQNNNTQTATQTPFSPVAKSFLKDKVSVLFNRFDTKLQKFIPDKRLRRIMEIVMLSFAGIFILLFLFGIIASVGRPKEQSLFTLTKPKIIGTTPQPESSYTTIQKQLVEMKNNVNNISFPDPLLKMPILEIKITTEKKR